MAMRALMTAAAAWTMDGAPLSGGQNRVDLAYSGVQPEWARRAPVQRQQQWSSHRRRSRCRLDPEEQLLQFGTCTNTWVESPGTQHPGTQHLVIAGEARTVTFSQRAQWHGSGMVGRSRTRRCARCRQKDMQW